MTSNLPFTVYADLAFTYEPENPAKPNGPRKVGIRGWDPKAVGASAGWSGPYRFATLAEAEHFASKTTIFGRRTGNRIGGPGSESSPYNASPVLA